MSTTPTAADAAQAVAESLQLTPDLPVVVHWQLGDFPIHVARRLLDARHTLVWVYPSAERGDIAESALKEAGIAVRRHLGANEAVARVTGVPTKYLSDNTEPFEQPRVDPVADKARRANLSELAKVRLKALCNLADAPMDAPTSGCVTLISMGMLQQPGIIGQLAQWVSPVVLFDHVTSLNVRWMDVRSSGGDFNKRVETLSPEKFAPARLLAERIPQVFVMRDEWACRLVSAYFNEHGVTEVATAFRPRQGLNVSVFATDLVHSGFDTATFLNMALRAEAGHQLVGQGIFGAHTPDSLSMSGKHPLTRAVVKVTHPREEEAKVMSLQVTVTHQEYAEIRARDHVRTALLAIDRDSRNPEIVVLVSPTLARPVAALAGADVIKLGHWGQTNHARSITPHSISPNGSKFQHSVLNALLKQFDSITDGRRYRKLLELVKAERAVLSPPRMAMRLARFANCLTNIARVPNLDFAARDEDNVGSDRADKATRLFSQLLDDCYPWKAYDKSANANDCLAVRQRVFSQYRAFRAAKN